MRKTLKEIAKLVNGQITGDENTVITGVSGIKEADEGDITFVANPKYFHLIDNTRASAVIADKDIVSQQKKPILRTQNPSLAFAQVVASFAPDDVAPFKGIHPTAVLGKDLRLG